MMRIGLIPFIICWLAAATLVGQEVQITDPVRLLALGDSYTFGESVAVEDRWPDQLADTLISLGLAVDEIAVVAMTGWTTGNLLDALDADPPDEDFSLVSLLIGVNNQFNGQSIVQYEQHFEELLIRAIQYAGGDPSHVFVMSIPDYRYTPFGESMNGVSIEIDEFNSVNEGITNDYGVTYVYITDVTRRGLDEPELVAGDGLHPSPLMYALWVRRILEHADLEITSVESPLKHPHIQLYPNPVRDYLKVEHAYPIQCTVIRMDGTAVPDLKWHGSGFLEVRDLDPGIYLLEAKRDSEVEYGRFVKF